MVRSGRVIELDDREKQLRDDCQWVLGDRVIQRQHARKVVVVYKRKVWGIGPNPFCRPGRRAGAPRRPSQQELALVYVEGRVIA